MPTVPEAGCRLCKCKMAVMFTAWVSGGSGVVLPDGIGQEYPAGRKCRKVQA